MWGDGDGAAAADPHPSDSLVPTLDYLTSTDGERKRSAAVPGRIELAAGAPAHPDIVNVGQHSGCGFGAVAHDMIFDDQIGGGVAFGDGDGGALGRIHSRSGYRPTVVLAPTARVETMIGGHKRAVRDTSPFRWLVMVGLLLLVGCSGTVAERLADPTRPSPNDDPESDNPDADNERTPEGRGPDFNSGRGTPLVPIQPDEPTAATREQISQLEGLLAVEDNGRMQILEPSGSAALPALGDFGTRNGQATWSGVGDRLAWIRITTRGSELVVLSLDTGAVQGTPLGAVPAFYLQWDAADTMVAYLRNSARGEGIEMGVIEPGKPPQPINEAAPYYFAWSPGLDSSDPVPSSRLAVHINGLLLAAMLAVPPDYSSSEPIAVDVAAPTGLFTTPAWLDDTTLLAVSLDGLSRFDITTGKAELLVDEPGAYQFTVSPDRSRVAYVVDAFDDEPVQSRVLAPRRAPVKPNDGAPTLQPVQASDPDKPALESDEPDPGSAQEEGTEIQGGGRGLMVLDLATGETELVTAHSPMAWEWSPNSQRLAWLHPNTLSEDGEQEIAPGGAESGELRWWFWEAGEGGTVSSLPFRPSETVARQHLPFFEQYAESRSRWSPDNNGFAFAGTIGGVPAGPVNGIWVQLVDADVHPVLISEGDAVTWSPPIR